MCGSVLTGKSTVLDRTSIIPLTVEDHNNQAITELREKFTESLNVKLKDRAAAMKMGKDAV